MRIGILERLIMAAILLLASIGVIDCIVSIVVSDKVNNPIECKYNIFRSFNIVVIISITGDILHGYRELNEKRK